MSTISTAHTLVPNAVIPYGYYDEDNIRFIQRKIVEVLRREYNQDILIDRDSIVRLMDRALLARIETIPKMNQRVVMMACNDYRNHQQEVNRNLMWEGQYIFSQRLYDPTVDSGRFDLKTVKTPNRLGVPKVGATTRFYFN